MSKLSEWNLIKLWLLKDVQLTPLPLHLINDSGTLSVAITWVPSIQFHCFCDFLKACTETLCRHVHIWEIKLISARGPKANYGPNQFWTCSFTVMYIFVAHILEAHNYASKQSVSLSKVWLSTLQGLLGDSGADGPFGDNGPKGVRGRGGASGSTGNRGASVSCPLHTKIWSLCM